MSLGFREVLTRALTAGLAVGVVFGAYLFFVVEPIIDDAIELEELAPADAAEPSTDDHHGDGTSAADEADHHGEDALFTRGEQTAGGVAATILYSTILAGVFGVVFARVRHRLPGWSDVGRSAWLAAAGFVCLGLLPALVHPANPPGIGNPDDVNERTLAYVLLVAVAIVVTVGLFRAAAALRMRLGASSGAAATAGLAVVAYGLLVLVMPGTAAETPAHIPGSLVWDFRIRSLGGLALVWAGIGIGLGWLLDRETADAASVDAPLLADA